ncbi:BON domain-containing protein [Flavobacterium sp.]|uniref:BON domain-containing protein n=1 Tax=Flavobacterium sp. TaxID=239 RepID=UPI00375346E0
MEENKIVQEIIENNIDFNLNVNTVNVSVIGNNVTLKGIVYSNEEKDQIENIAWNAYGVKSVSNQLSIYNETTNKRFYNSLI